MCVLKSVVDVAADGPAAVVAAETLDRGNGRAFVLPRYGGRRCSLFVGSVILVFHISAIHKMTMKRKHYRAPTPSVDKPAPRTAHELADLWGKSEQNRETETPAEPATAFFSALRRGLHQWGLAEAQYKSQPNKSGGLPESPRELLLQAVRQIMEGAGREQYWVVYASRQVINRLLSVELDPPEVIASIAAREQPIPNRAGYVYRHWQRRLQQSDDSSRTVSASGVSFLPHIVSFRYRHGRAVAALLMRDEQIVSPNPDCELRYVDLVRQPADTPTIPPSEAALWVSLIELRREKGDELTALKLRQLAAGLGVPSVVTTYLRLMRVASDLARKRRGRSLTEMVGHAAIDSVVTISAVHTDGSLAIAGDGGVGDSPSVADVLAELAESSRVEASDAADRLLAYAGTFAPRAVLESQRRTFKRLFDEGRGVVDPLIHELAMRSHLNNADTWAIDARNEWLSHELAQERAANLGQGRAPDVERAVRRSRTPRTPSLLEQQAMRAVARGAVPPLMERLRKDLESWLRLLNDRLLDVSVEKRIEQELFVRVKLWTAISRIATTEVRFDEPSETASDACMKYLTKNEGRLLAALYRVLHLIQVPAGFPQYTKRWVRQRRKAPLVDTGEQAVEHLALQKIFTSAEQVAGWRYFTDRDLVALQKVVDDFLYLLSRFQPLAREVQVRLAQELRVMTEVFHLAFYSLRRRELERGDR